MEHSWTLGLPSNDLHSLHKNLQAAISGESNSSNGPYSSRVNAGQPKKPTRATPLQSVFRHADHQRQNYRKSANQLEKRMTLKADNVDGFRFWLCRHCIFIHTIFRHGSQKQRGLTAKPAGALWISLPSTSCRANLSSVRLQTYFCASSDSCNDKCWQFCGANIRAWSSAYFFKIYLAWHVSGVLQNLTVKVILNDICLS